MRGNAGHSFRPIKEFYAEGDQAEWELDIAWLESKLNRKPRPPDEDAGYNPVPAPEEYVEEAEGDIYNDVSMPPPPQPANLPAESGDIVMLAVDSAEQPGSNVEAASRPGVKVPLGESLSSPTFRPRTTRRHT
ncbi:hypothetical protein FRC10_010620 [Ceratobasidium sp. 414]|nr:hypothetical protein FRC10_010620 [Ceratobasidium sp. 414]